MPLTITELKELVAERYDPDDIVELLEITTEQLLAVFEDEFITHKYKFEEEEETNGSTE